MAAQDSSVQGPVGVTVATTVGPLGFLSVYVLVGYHSRGLMKIIINHPSGRTGNGNIPGLEETRGPVPWLNPHVEGIIGSGSAE